MTKIQIALQNRAAQVRDEEQGATMVEYGLMVSLVALVAAVGAAALGTGIDGLFDTVVTKL